MSKIKQGCQTSQNVCFQNACFRVQRKLPSVLTLSQRRKTLRSRKIVVLNVATNEEVAIKNPLEKQQFKLEYPRSHIETGGMDVTTSGATSSLCGRPITREKHIVIVRHGQTTWNLEGRIQGSSDESHLTELGMQQAERCRDALSQQHFDNCFSSPISRARSAAKIMWEERKGSIVYLETLKEANLGFLQGMLNEVALVECPEVYRAWRETPASFHIDNHFPVLDVFAQARKAWVQILEAEGSSHLVVTHKSILRALLCTALGLPPSAFRAIDCHNGGINIFKVNKRGEAMLTNLNMTAHMHYDNIKY
eukprot:TRINITY_DN2882_c0_g3_i1.p2 TRINITY_DN2882_c0_g3~~TRINITY_DN2882_c0_g3_i1.p2  ORF type:complete len:352 (-),score=28.12 TRINITY_DN2882_c0_g3_i1:533-1456(-)